jgi:hypothetical protein
MLPDVTESVIHILEISDLPRDDAVHHESQPGIARPRIGCRKNVSREQPTVAPPDDWLPGQKFSDFVAKTPPEWKGTLIVCGVLVHALIEF